MGAYGTLHEKIGLASKHTQGTVDSFTRYNISGIKLVVIFDEAEAVHQLDLRDFTRAMAAEVFFDVTFGH
jgi:hypothetical protein